MPSSIEFQFLRKPSDSWESKYGAYYLKIDGRVVYQDLEAMLGNVAYCIDPYVEMLKKPFPQEPQDELDLLNWAIHLKGANTRYYYECHQFYLEERCRQIGIHLERAYPIDVRNRLNVLDLDFENGPETQQFLFLFAWRPISYVVSYSNDAGFQCWEVSPDEVREALVTARGALHQLLAPQD